MRRRDFLALAAASALPRWAHGREELLSQVGYPQNLATPLPYFDRSITPSRVFFVRSHFGPPALKATRRLKIDGLVDKPLDLGLADLRRFPEVTITSVLQCAGNGRGLQEPSVPGIQWGHGAMGQATFTGVRLADLLAKAGVQSGAAHLRLAGADLPPMPTVPRYVRGLPIARALDPTTLVAYRMNGRPLTLAHGAPLRLVVPGWTGNHWIKWLTEIRVQEAEAEGFYAQTGYRRPHGSIAPGQVVPADQMVPVTWFPVKSVIARPADGSLARVGPQEVVGVAVSGQAPISRVEVTLDDGATWTEAALEGEAGVGRWQVFRHRFVAGTPGPYRVAARATDREGASQPRDPAWNPSGYLWNAWHQVAWSVQA